jgi:hypothetical protein
MIKKYEKSRRRDRHRRVRTVSRKKYKTSGGGNEKFQKLFNSTEEQKYTVNFRNHEMIFNFSTDKISLINNDEECIKIIIHEKFLYIAEYYYKTNYIGCGKILHKDMFDLITIFAKLLNKNYVSLTDTSHSISNICEQNYGIFRKIAIGKSFYELYDFKYNKEFYNNYEKLANKKFLKTFQKVHGVAEELYRNFLKDNQQKKIEDITYGEIIKLFYDKCTEIHNSRKIDKKFLKFYNDLLFRFKILLMIKDVNYEEMQRTVAAPKINIQIDILNKIININDDDDSGKDTQAKPKSSLFSRILSSII